MNFFSSRGTEKIFRVHPSKNFMIEEMIEEIEMKNLQSSLPNPEKKDTCLDVVAHLDKEISFDEDTVSENTTSIDSLPSTSFQNFNPLMSPVSQKKLIAHAKIEKLKNSIQRGWEINRYLDEARANFVRKKTGKKRVRFAIPLVSDIFDDEEDSGVEISLSERIQMFLDEVKNLEWEVESNEDVEHLFHEEKENLRMDVETSEDTEHLQDEFTFAEEIEMASPEIEKNELLTDMMKWQVCRFNGMSMNGFKQVQKFATPMEC